MWMMASHVFPCFRRHCVDGLEKAKDRDMITNGNDFPLSLQMIGKVADNSMRHPGTEFLAWLFVKRKMHLRVVEQYQIKEDSAVPRKMKNKQK